MTSNKGSHVNLDDYRITSAVEIQALLKQILESNALVTLSGPQGASHTTLLWAVDTSRGVICFSAEADDPSLESLLESDEVVAVAYLDSIKVQFDVEGLVHVHGGHHSALNAQIPKEVFRFQRRDSFRVKPFSSHSPQAQFRHPGMPDMMLNLRILDVSLGGMALFLPDSIPMVEAGSKIGRCIVDLDGDTRIEAGMKIHHVTVLHPEYHGARLGCEFVGMDGGTMRSLQHYINQTQKRRSALSLDKS
ncbi:MAG TPA: flagellar brake protein [Aquabacterium sp.]|nr:flagellar brake protein [Aquabacterium sp.]